MQHRSHKEEVGGNGWVYKVDFDTENWGSHPVSHMLFGFGKLGKDCGFGKMFKKLLPMQDTVHARQMHKGLIQQIKS